MEWFPRSNMMKAEVEIPDARERQSVAEIYVQLGEQAYASQHYDEAMLMFGEAMFYGKGSDVHSMAMIWLARSLSKEGLHDDALYRIGRALALENTSETHQLHVHRAHGEILARAGNITEANKAFIRWHRLVEEKGINIEYR